MCVHFVVLNMNNSCDADNRRGGNRKKSEPRKAKKMQSFILSVKAKKAAAPGGERKGHKISSLSASALLYEPLSGAYIG